MSAWIACPVLLGVLVGKWLENKYDCAPWGILGMVGLAFFISMFGVVKVGLIAINKIDQENKKNESQQIKSTKK